MNRDQEHTIDLPTTRNLAVEQILTLVVTIIMVVASVTGLVDSAAIYPTDELAESFVPNDVVNLVVGLPTLLGSMWLVRRRKLVGLLFWPGALFFVFYNYLVYLFALPLTWMFLPHLVLVTMSVYTIVGLVASIDGAMVQQRLEGSVRERVTGGVMAGLGALFLVQVVSVVIGALVNQTPVADTELAVHVSDFMIAPALIVGGVLLWRHKEFGYVIGLGLLFQASMLFIGLIAYLLLQPLLTDALFALVDVVVTTVMGLVCFVPFGLFLRGVARA